MAVAGVMIKASGFMIVKRECIMLADCCSKRLTLIDGTMTR